MVATVVLYMYYRIEVVVDHSQHKGKKFAGEYVNLTINDDDDDEEKAPPLVAMLCLNLMVTIMSFS